MCSDLKKEDSGVLVLSDLFPSDLHQIKPSSSRKAFVLVYLKFWSVLNMITEGSLFDELLVRWYVSVIYVYTRALSCISRVQATLQYIFKTLLQ